MDDVHWVIRNARLHAADPALRTAAGFARALGGAPHRAQVARWEDGQVALTHRLVRRYEEVLGLPHGQLLRAIDLITRDRSPINRMPVIPAPVPDDIAPEALPLLERARQYAPMTGLDWDRLTTLLGSVHHVLVRERDWETLLYRLSLETSVSTGLEYVLDGSGLRPERQEATRRAIMRRLAEQVPSDDGDPVLERLVRTSLEDPHLDSRDTALGVLLLSSQGVPMGVELGARLEVVVADDEMTQARAHLSMLSWLVRVGSLDLLTVLTTDLHRPPEVTSLAAAALGNCTEPGGPAREARDALLAGHAHDHILLRHKDAGVPSGNAWGIGYALGMRGRFDLITELSQLPECERDRDWRPALAWWLDLPEVLRSTR